MYNIENTLNNINENIKQLNQNSKLIQDDLNLIKKSLNILPDKFTQIEDIEKSIIKYENYAQSNNLNQTTINNQKSAIRGFLVFSKGIINPDTVKNYLNSNDKNTWKSNQVKALRKYIRDYLKLGNWINKFEFKKDKAKIKKIPNVDELSQFCSSLHFPTWLIFLLTYNSGLRIGEILALKVSNINFELNMIDASNIHKSEIKESWISFFTDQTANLLKQTISQITNIEDDPLIFDISYKSIQESFKQVSENTGIKITPHLLRTAFTEKCTEANISEKYINAFCGRVNQKIISKHYTDYSPQSLRRQYDKVESFLVLNFKN